GDIVAGKGVADQRHDTLGDALGDIHRYHVDLLADADGGNCAGAIGGGEIVQDGHAGDVEQVLNRSGDAHRADTGDNVLLEAEFLGIDADKGVAALDKQQHKEVQAGNTVGEE